MIAQAQGVLSNSVNTIMGASSAARTLAGAHPVGLGIVVGLGAYFVIDKYWLNNEDSKDTHEEEAEEESTEVTA